MSVRCGQVVIVASAGVSLLVYVFLHLRFFELAFRSFLRSP
jgi:hypothetical protein